MEPRSRAVRAPFIAASPPRALAITTVFSVLAACGASSQQATPDRPADEFVHAFTGMAFPNELAGFQRSDVTPYDEVGADTSVTYDDPAGVHVTAYVYPVRSPAPNALTVEFEDAVHAIAMFFEGLAIDSYQEVVLATRPGEPGLAMFATGLQPGSPPEHVYTLLYLFRFGGWFLKYRVSYPFELGQRGLARFEELMRHLAWPEGPIQPPPPSTPPMLTQRE